MSEHFNKLSPGEAERLAMLSEECGEIIQAVGKILRHGYDSYHPADTTTTNRDLLTKELVDLYAVVELMDSDFAIINADEQNSAYVRKLRYTHHQLR